MSNIKNILAAMGAFGVILFSGTAEAAWPERPVTIITQAGAGAVIDLATRQVAAMLSEELGQPFLVTNQSGAGGNLAVNAMLQAKPDGYTMVTTGPNPYGFNLLTMKVRYKFEDLAPVSLIQNTCMAIIALPDKGWKGVKDAYDAARAENRPLKVAVMDNLSRDILVKIGEKEGVKVAPIPQKGGMAILSTILGGHADIGLVGSIAVENTRAGKIVTLASASSKRFDTLPDVPTLREQGYDFIDDAFVVLSFSREVPDEIVEKASQTMIKISQTEAYKKMLETLSVEAAPMGRVEAAKLTRAEYENKRALLGK